MPDEIQFMVFLDDIFKDLRLGNNLNDEQTKLLSSQSLSPVQQCSALSALTLRTKLSASEIACVTNLAERYPAVTSLLGRSDLLLDSPSYTNNSSESSDWNLAFRAIIQGKAIGKKVISTIVNDIVSNETDQTRTSALLMAICVKGIQPKDTVFLTNAMASSGDTFDYRGHEKLGGARLIRRYPTGALSEKTALILPALIACARNITNVCSPFLVAKSLGYTGGTWDKLSAIQGFRFPLPGEETISALAKCGVAMTVTKGSANPADRILYQLRSVTGTIESIPLIVASIASKHISFPVHHLLMDVRYGTGAFMETREEANLLGNELQKVLSQNNIPTFYELTDTSQPSGSAIGNALEVAEAIAVLSHRNDGIWDRRAIESQRQIVIKFFALLMDNEFPGSGLQSWIDFASEQFSNGKALSSFYGILLAHDVSPNFAKELLDKPMMAIGVDRNPVDILSELTGTLVHIKQRKLGEIINRHLGGGGNIFSGSFDPKSALYY